MLSSYLGSALHDLWNKTPKRNLFLFCFSKLCGSYWCHEENNTNYLSWPAGVMFHKCTATGVMFSMSLCVCVCVQYVMLQYWKHWLTVRCSVLVFIIACQTFAAIMDTNLAFASHPPPYSLYALFCNSGHLPSLSVSCLSRWQRWLVRVGSWNAD